MKGKNLIVVICVLLLIGIVIGFSNDYYLKVKENRAYQKRISPIEALYSNLLLTKEDISGYITICLFS